MALIFGICFLISDLAVAKYCGNVELHKSVIGDSQKLKSLSLNRDETTKVPEKKNRCCPYDFDGRICSFVDDRVLCGFNKNIEKPNSENNPIELSTGCRIRGGRLECGYVHGPFIHQRRPSIPNIQDTNQIGDHGSSQIDVSKENLMQALKRPSTTPQTPVTKCLELRNQIVCRELV
ncbi:hypothetical protein ACJJTC_003205 [Scirpophaga incertulas]